MIRAFIDSSLFFAASLSSHGASNEILQAAVRGNVLLVISNLVREETERNLRDTVPHVLAAFHAFLDAVPFELSNPTAQEVAEAAGYTFLKDAPIVAAAKKANVDYLASLDRKHLVGVPEVTQGSGLTIVLPEELLEAIRKQLGSI